MKKLVAGLVFATTLLFPSLSAFASVYVNGYTKSNGTYVQGYYRSDPNSTVTDNYSYIGNVNPYTGSVGTNYYTDSPSSPYYGGSGMSVSQAAATGNLGSSFYNPTPTPTYTAPTYTYTPIDYSVPKIKSYYPWIVTAWADQHPSTSCFSAPLTISDQINCSNYRLYKANSNYDIQKSDTIDSAYVSCDGGTNYHFLNSDGTSYVCPTSVSSNSDTDQQALINSLLATIASLQAQIAAIQAAKGN